MSDIIEFFSDIVSQSASLLDGVVFNVFGITVSWFDLMLSFLALCIIIAVFWRGAHK